MEILTLRLSAEQADAHFRMAAQTRQAGQALAALIALQSFIAETARPDSPDDRAGTDIKRILDRHIASARNRVMEENLLGLLEALGTQNLCGIQSVHGALSRNGFHQTVLAAIPHLSDTALPATAAWVADWHRDARARAEAASPYPDALDLRGAGISPAGFAAMAELNVYLQEALSWTNPKKA